MIGFSEGPLLIDFGRGSQRIGEVLASIGQKPEHLRDIFGAKGHQALNLMARFVSKENNKELNGGQYRDRHVDPKTDEAECDHCDKTPEFIGKMTNINRLAQSIHAGSSGS